LSGAERIDAFCLPDNCGGHPSLAPKCLGSALLDAGLPVLVHLACKDANRNGLLSRALALASLDCRDLLIVTGDLPAGGFRGRAQPVFDLDSVALLELLRRLGKGELGLAGARPGRALPPERFFTGAVVSPYKREASELLPQLRKLELKVACGAEFVITQAGWDSRKLAELRRWADHAALRVPLIADVQLLSAGAARRFHGGAVPGVIVTDALLELVERRCAGADRGREFCLDLAARQIAIARGLGYRGVYLAGIRRPADLDRVLQLEAGYRTGDWRELARAIDFGQPGEFYLFGAGAAAETGADAAPPSRTADPAGSSWSERLFYRANQTVHDLLFQPGTAGYRAARKLVAAVDANPRARAWFHGLELSIKLPLYGCRDCGDCSLPELAYQCPQAGCPKRQRNGPCGGSLRGRCEDGARECVWSRAYRRLRAAGRLDRLLPAEPILCDAGLARTSSWVNFFLQRDHHARSRELSA
jgi:methylenetetrahydrofolate reductase (NADPH)